MYVGGKTMCETRDKTRDETSNEMCKRKMKDVPKPTSGIRSRWQIVTGHMIRPNGLQMDPAKVKVIQDWPKPQKVKDIQSFLGFANFYRRYIHNYSNIVVPLTYLTWKNIPWNFNESCKLVFLTLKQAFISALVLTHYKPGCLLVIETDASDYALAAILSLKLNPTEKSIQLPIYLGLSQTLNLTQCTYSSA
jgi:RNase H-like domain found in reverse transcriptase